MNAQFKHIELLLQIDDQVRILALFVVVDEQL